jgi:hypothetical protein
MATFTKAKLSGSTDGKAIKVTGTSTGATVTVHTAVAGTAAGVKLTLEWGTATAADGNIELTIAAESGLVLVIPGLILQNAMVVKAFAATADVILLTGYVNAITA